VEVNHIGKLLIAAVATAVLLMVAGCTSGTGLSAGLTTRMDRPGASLESAEALMIVNDYRRTTGAAALRNDQLLDAMAHDLALSYAQSGSVPALPAGAVLLRVSAGYPTFAETFSGWRNSPADAAALGETKATRAGIGVAYDANSTYGVYWVLVLDD
jgi:uncharacterized protein YkwD